MESFSEEEKQLLPRPSFSEDPYRFVIIALYCISTFIVSLSFYGLSSVSTQIRQIYGPSLFLMNIYSSGYMIVNLVCGVPIAYLLSYCSVKANILLMIITGILGSWLRCLVNSAFSFAVIGHYFLGFSFSFFRSIIPRISAIWIAPEKRATSSALMYAFLSAAVSLSLYLPSLVINVDTVTPAQYSYYQSRLFYFFLIYAITATLLGIPVLILFRQKPRTPVSLTATMARLNFSSSFKDLCSNLSFLALTFISSVSVALMVGLQIVMEQAYKNYGSSSKAIGIAGLVSMVFIAIVPLIASHLAGKYSKFKLCLTLFTFSAWAAFGLLMVGLHLKSAVVFGLVQIISSFSAGAIVSMALQFGAQICFPVPETFSTSFIVIAVKLFTVLVVLTSTAFINSSLIKQLTLMFFLLQTLCCVVVFFISSHLKRRRIDMNQESTHPQESNPDPI